jgi:catechol 2,3-dioxygenase-like lactoylglutathione lyase family enzyme
MHPSPKRARHVLTILAVADLPRAVRFYRKAFGWPRAVDTPVYTEFELPDGNRLGLYRREGFGRNVGRLPARVARGAITATELYLRVDDVAAVVRGLRAARVRELSPLAPRDWGDEVAYLADPDGNVLAVARLLDASAPVSPGAPAPAGPDGLAGCFARVDAVRHLVRDALGCGCPEEVFDDIHVAYPAVLRDAGERAARRERRTVPDSVKIVVGGRLLIVLVPAERLAALEEEAGALLVRGRATRDACGLNRFRLVLVGAVPARVQARLRAAARRLDDRTHVHVLAAASLRSLGRR